MAFLQQFPEFQLQLLLVLWCSLYYCQTLKQKYKSLKEKLDIWFCDQRNCRHKCTCTSQRRRRMWLVALHFPAYVCRSFPSKHTDLLACCSRTSTSSSVAFIATQTLTTVPVLIQYEPRYCYYNVFRNTCERLFDGGWYCVFSGQFFFPAVKYLFYYRFTKK